MRDELRVAQYHRFRFPRAWRLTQPIASERLARGLAFLAVYLIWGSTYLGIRVAVTTLPPFLLAGARSLLAGSSLLALARWRGVRRASSGEWYRAACAGLLMLAGGNGLVTFAETRLASNVAALLIATVPAFVVAFEWLRPGGRRPERRAAWGVALGVLGMLLLMRPEPGAIASGRALASVCMLLAAACWALGSVYIRHRRLHPDPMLAGAQQLVAGGAALLLVALCSGELSTFDPISVDGRSLVAFAYLTLFGSIVAFSAFNWLLRVSTPAQVSSAAYVNPLVAVVLGWLVLGEVLQPAAIAGAVFILGAVVLMVSRVKAAPPRPERAD